MSNELLRYLNGDAPVARSDRAVARQGKAVYDEVRLKALQVDGAMALAGHMMEGITTLDLKRQTLARASGSQELNVLLAQIEGTALAQAQQIQQKLYKWDL